MPDNETPTPQQTSGETEAPKSLREVAEAAWDTVVEEAPEEEQASEPEVDTQGRQRDEYGRFVKAEPGEAEAPPEPPSPDETTDAPQDQATQPREGVAEAPANWSEADRQAFNKLPPDSWERGFLIRRHSEMEGDYQRRVQTYAQAAQFAAGVAPVFNDPRIAGQLQQWGMSAQDAVNQWGNFQLQATDPNLTVRAGFILDLAQRIGVPLNPAAIGQPQTSPQGPLPEPLAKDPAIKWFADYIGQVSAKTQGLEAKLGQMEHASQEAAEAEALRVTRWGIDSFAAAKDQQGNLLHPDFDAVIDQIEELYKANPNRDMNEAYETACNMNPNVRTRRMQREIEVALKRQTDQRAAQAARLNVRGRTGPVSGPNGAAAGPRSLRETIEATADELGI